MTNKVRRGNPPSIGGFAMTDTYLIIPQTEVDESEIDEILERIKQNAQKEANN